MSGTLELEYTGNPFVDVGLAAIMAHVENRMGVKKRKPSDLTIQDLTVAADYLKGLYTDVKPIINQSLTLFPNGFGEQSLHPSKSKVESAEQLFKKRSRLLKYADDVLYGFMPQRPRLSVYCTFFPKRRAYRYIHRQFLPLLGAEGDMNFAPQGAQDGLPVSGEALLAIASILLGSFRPRYWLLFHEVKFSNSVSHDMTLTIARKALANNYKTFTSISLDPKMDWSQSKRPRQLYVDTILDAIHEVESRSAVKLGNVTGYHFTNYGTGPHIEVLRLENDVWEFISEARNVMPTAWARYIMAGEIRRKNRNLSYEVLFTMPHEYRRFMLLLKKVADWKFAELFLKKVMKMDQSRIDRLKGIGDVLYTYMQRRYTNSSGQKSFYYKFARTSKLSDAIEILRSVSEQNLFDRQGSGSTLTVDQIVNSFVQTGSKYESWTLARDLVAFRILEQFAQIGESITEDEEVDDSEESESSL